LKEHPELQTFLNQHPGLKEESAETPKHLMQREQRYDAREQARGDRDRNSDRDWDANAQPDRDFNRDRERDASGDRDANASRDRVSPDRDASDRDMDRRRNPDTDVNNRQVASVDDFLDRHQDVAKSLQKNPKLINDQSYLKRHKDLSEFLSEHPAVREEVRENPSSFMRRENQFEARNADRDRLDRDRSDRDRAAVKDRDRNVRDVDNDLSKKELQDMDHFLDKHKKIEKDLQRNPTLANDHDYLKNHKQLDSFLSKNPRVVDELRANPSTFMQKQQRLEQHRMTNPPAAKPKTKVEQKEQTHTATPH
jgi:phage-related protein